MWIVIPLQEIKGLLRNNVRRFASWILVFLDILKIIGNSWEVMRKGLYALTPGPNMDLSLQPPAPYLEKF